MAERNNDCVSIEYCRACGSKNMEDILDLGEQALANSLKEQADDKQTTYSLSTAFCKG